MVGDTQATAAAPCWQRSGRRAGLGLAGPDNYSAHPCTRGEERRGGQRRKQGMKRQGERREFNWCQSIVGLVCLRIYINEVTQWKRSRVWCLSIQRVGFSAIYLQKRNILFIIMFTCIFPWHTFFLQCVTTPLMQINPTHWTTKRRAGTLASSYVTEKTVILHTR